jgi:hypothetical protein
MWENWGHPFKTPFIIKDIDYWNQFWEQNKLKKTYSQRDIYIALRNIHCVVNNGDYEARYISSDPCKFIQGGMIDRGLSFEDVDTGWGFYHSGTDKNLELVKGDVYG